MERHNLKEYKTTSFWMNGVDEEIIFWNYAPALEMDITIARELVRDRLAYTHGRSVYALIDVTNLKTTTKEARDFMNSKDGGLKGLLGGAFLSNNVVATLLVNLYLKVNTPAIPARFFTNRQDALNWLLKIKMENAVLK
ncbi:DUF7793 family protein [Parachryseolinea silvisoli]|jgi:hypothetical protein|uniref:DUF7793 family protein n=1 Tax=Parachryseolinea silvisoli TaxID=2873601 RepID=UPI002265BD36|nr:hypothetical protein [Parachryseolinea silvisoli]MCD9013995.1 hypothetical protein [Parachryseolinea silvisoli]